MRIAALVLSLALAAPLAAHAEADPPAPDAAKVELARKVIEASGGARNAEAMVRQIYGSLDGAFSDALTPDQQQVLKAFQHDMQDELLKLIPVILDQSVQIYARNLSEKELMDMLAWQTSESGQSISRKLPLLTQDIVKAEIPYIREMMPRMMQKAVDRACDEAKCTTEQRQQVAQIVAQALAKKRS